jgi:hypothetical protein
MADVSPRLEDKVFPLEHSKKHVLERRKLLIFLGRGCSDRV